jgi:hypothetical protein
MANPLAVKKRDKGYSPPKFAEVQTLLNQLRDERQPVIDRIWAMKRARRQDWNETIKSLPAPFKKLPLVLGDSDVPEMITRVAGLVSREEPVIEVLPASARRAEVEKASKEEARLNALRIEIQDQQDRDVYAMGIDAQCAWGESWISVSLDNEGFDEEEVKRRKKEGAKEYIARHQQMMLENGIPIRFEDHDPQTVFPLRDRKERLVKVIIESDHPEYEIRDVYGYRRQAKDGKTVGWKSRKTTLGEARVTNSARSPASNPVDIEHDDGRHLGDGSPRGNVVKRIVYMDQWCTLTFLDEIEVERWEHNYGCLPIFPAMGKMTSDRDPAYQSEGIADVSLVIAKQMVLFTAMMASLGILQAFPTPFIEGATALTDPRTGQPVTRSVKLGEINLLMPGEKISFPFSEVSLSADAYRTMDRLDQKLSDTTLGNFNKALGTEGSGYQLAQIRSMQMAILGGVYRGAERQWRKIAYFLRHLIQQDLKGGVYLRGAVEETEDGDQYRPILEYRAEDTTEYAIDVHIDQGILQDMMAERKSAIEMNQAGIWSRRRAMETSGVDDPAREDDEIAIERLSASPALDQLVLNITSERAAQRVAAMQQMNESSPFSQALQAAKQAMGGPGQFQNQGAEPANALPGGQPMQQNPSPPTPQQGGPAAGPPAGGPGNDLKAAGAPGLPGGVSGGQGPAV